MQAKLLQSRLFLREERKRRLDIIGFMVVNGERLFVFVVFFLSFLLTEGAGDSTQPKGIDFVPDCCAGLNGCVYHSSLGAIIRGSQDSLGHFH